MSIAALGSVVSGMTVTTPALSKPASNGLANFSSFLESVGNGAVSNIRNAEQASISALNGNASVREVAEAVMSAEQSLQLAVSVRDKIVSAYLEISRMAI